MTKLDKASKTRLFAAAKLMLGGERMTVKEAKVLINNFLSAHPKLFEKEKVLDIIDAKRFKIFKPGVK